jgi:hypothetical protein
MKADESGSSVRRFGFRAPRVSTNFSFSLEVIATGERYDAVCTDISEDGLAAELRPQLAPSTQVRMRMLLPGATLPLLIQASVEYSQDRRCGLNFLYSNLEERKQVQAFIQSIS